MKFFSPFYLLLIILFAFSIVGCAENKRKSEEYQQRALRAKVLYDQEKYKEAIDSMSLLPLYAGASIPSYAEMYNLGNTYYRKGDWGWAILYYERALRIEPRSKDVKHNLVMARSKTMDRVQYRRPLASELWHSFCYALPLGTIYFFSLLFFLLFVLGLLFYFFGAKRLIRQWGFYSALVSFLLTLLTLAELLQWNRDFYSTREAVVVVGQSSLKSDPSDNAQILFKVNEGTKLIHEQKKAGAVGDGDAEWVFVSLPDGKEGWIFLEDIEFIYPFSKS